MKNSLISAETRKHSFQNHHYLIEVSLVLVIFSQKKKILNLKQQHKQDKQKQWDLKRCSHDKGVFFVSKKATSNGLMSTSPKMHAHDQTQKSKPHMCTSKKLYMWFIFVWIYLKWCEVE